MIEMIGMFFFFSLVLCWIIWCLNFLVCAMGMVKWICRNNLTFQAKGGDFLVSFHTASFLHLFLIDQMTLSTLSI